MSIRRASFAALALATFAACGLDPGESVVSIAVHRGDEILQTEFIASAVAARFIVDEHLGDATSMVTKKKADGTPEAELVIAIDGDDAARVPLVAGSPDLARALVDTGAALDGIAAGGTVSGATSVQTFFGTIAKGIATVIGGDSDESGDDSGSTAVGVRG